MPPNSVDSRADVTVVTPTYNSVRTIVRCINSVVGQTKLPLEHIVIDDGSNDGTTELLDALSVEHHHLKVIPQSNLGAGAARNKGIEMARGRFIAFLDSDDEWSADKLERQVRFMIEHDAPFSYGDYVTIDAGSNRRIGTQHMPEAVSHREFLRGCPIGCLTAAFDQKALGKVYMPDVRRGQDWGLWLSLTRDGTVARRYPGCCAMYYAAVGQSLSSNKLAKVSDIYQIYRVQERLNVLAAAYYTTVHSLSAMKKKRRGQIGKTLSK